jgi:hypothetical protein
MSSSALRTHCAVWRFIEQLSLLDHFAEKPVAIVWPQAAFDLLRRANYDRVRKQPFEGSADSDCLSDHVVGRHDDQQIDVTLRVWTAVSVGAEQDYLVWMEALGDLAGKASNRQGELT